GLDVAVVVEDSERVAVLEDPGSIVGQASGRQDVVGAAFGMGPRPRFFSTQPVDRRGVRDRFGHETHPCFVGVSEGDGIRAALLVSYAVRPSAGLQQRCGRGPLSVHPIQHATKRPGSGGRARSRLLRNVPSRVMPGGYLATFTSRVTLFAPGPRFRTSSLYFSPFVGLNLTS